MAILRRNDIWISVPPGGEVGRGVPDLTLDLRDEGVSRHHALFDYRSEPGGTVAFYVRDLGSTNGTFVDGVRVASAALVRLVESQRIGFGSAEPWQVVDAGPPNPAVVCDGKLRVSADEVLSLPHEEQEDCVVLRDGLRWLLYVGDRAAAVRNGDSIDAGGRQCTLVLPEHLVGRPSTAPDGSPTERVHLVLHTWRARDETPEATLFVGRALHDLGRHIHNRELLALAVARKADTANGRPLEDRGWRSTRQLASTLGVDRTVLNVWTCRLRQRLRDCGVELIQDDPGGRNGSRRRLAECEIEVHDT